MKKGKKLTKKNRIKSNFEKGIGKGSSNYGKKIALQKSGIFSINSPFKINDTIGVSLLTMIKLRFKNT